MNLIDSPNSSIDTTVRPKCTAETARLLDAMLADAFDAWLSMLPESDNADGSQDNLVNAFGEFERDSTGGLDAEMTAAAGERGTC